MADSAVSKLATPQPEQSLSVDPLQNENGQDELQNAGSKSEPYLCEGFKVTIKR